MRAPMLTMLTTAMMALALPAPALAVVKVISGKNCKIITTPAALACPEIKWAFDPVKYTVTSVSASGHWSAGAANQITDEFSVPTAEFVFGATTGKVEGYSFSPAPPRGAGYDISDTPATANAGTFTYSVKTTSDKPRFAGIAESYIKNVKLTVNYTILPTSGTPEPGAWLLLIIGFGLTGVQLRRRRLSRTA